MNLSLPSSNKGLSATIAAMEGGDCHEVESTVTVQEEMNGISGGEELEENIDMLARLEEIEAEIMRALESTQAEEEEEEEERDREQGEGERGEQTAGTISGTNPNCSLNGVEGALSDRNTSYYKKIGIEVRQEDNYQPPLPFRVADRITPPPKTEKRWRRR